MIKRSFTRHMNMIEYRSLATLVIMVTGVLLWWLGYIP